MWSCSRGHSSLAVLLYQWCPATFGITNKYGMTALSLARYNGHNDLVKQLDQREMHRLSHQTSQSVSKPVSAITRSIAAGKPVTVCLSDPGQIAPPYLMHADSSRLSLSSSRDSNGESGKLTSAKIRRTRLLKRTSVEVLPDFSVGARGDSPVKYSKALVQNPVTRSKVREKQHSVDMVSESSAGGGGDMLAKDPMISITSRHLYSPVMFLQCGNDVDDNLVDSHAVGMETG